MKHRSTFSSVCVGTDFPMHTLLQVDLREMAEAVQNAPYEITGSN